jgi:hypothetical protein
MMEQPRLIENKTRDFLWSSLQTCHQKKINFYTGSFNVIILISFIGVFGYALYLSIKKQESPYEKYQRNLADQKYILEKIRHYKGQMDSMNEAKNITNLPNVYTPI